MLVGAEVGVAVGSNCKVSILTSLHKMFFFVIAIISGQLRWRKDEHGIAIKLHHSILPNLANCQDM